MKNGDARMCSAAVRDQTGCTHSLNGQSSGAGEKGTAEDSSAYGNAHAFTSNGLSLDSYNFNRKQEYFNKSQAASSS